MKYAVGNLLLLCLFLSLTACGGGSSPVPSVRLQLAASTLEISHDGTSASVSATAQASNTGQATAISAQNVPQGVQLTVTQPGTGSNATLSFAVTNPKLVSAASYPVVVQATSGTASSTATLTLAVTAKGSVTAETTGAHAAYMSTSFQLADWSYAWLQNHASALAPLGQLASKHIRLQAIDGALPHTDADQWNFTKIDALTQPVLGVGDHSPQMQIGAAPAFMYDSTGKLRDASYAEFAGFSANLVRYYNQGGFTASGQTYVSPSSMPITWWGVYNEPNINNVTADEYVRLYNAAGSAMLAVDPSIKLVAIELSDWGSEPQRFLPPLLAGATAPIDAVATHYYGTCAQTDTDQTVMNAVATFADHVAYFRSTLDANPATVGVPVWVTENNVNADWSNNGKSACNPNISFVSDPRGSSAFFAAWRPYVYSQLAKAGAQGLWHWSYTGDAQYGEVNDNGTPLLSFWVDYYLANWLDENAELLSTTSTDDGLELLAARRADGKIVVMVANRLVKSATDNNGTGVARKVTLDLSRLTFTAGTLVAIDSSTSAPAGPSPQTVAPSSKVQLSFPGYGVQFLLLSN